MAVRKLRGRYVVEFELRKRRIFRRLPAGATKGQAEALEANLRGELIDQAILGRKPNIRLDAAIKEWLREVVGEDRRETRSKANLVLSVVRGETLEQIAEVAERVRAMKSEEGETLAAATINRRLAVLKSTAKWAWKVKRYTRENLSPYVQMIDPRKEVVRTRTLSQAQILKLISKAPDFEVKAFIAFGAFGLLRQGEVMALTPKDISAHHVRAQSKNGPVRTIPVVPQLKPYLKAVPFTRHKRTLYAGFEAARDAAGFEDLVYHDLRRSGATILLNAGVALEVVSALLGHKSLETTRKIYAHVLQPTLQRAMRKGFRPIKNPSGKVGPEGFEPPTEGL